MLYPHQFIMSVAAAEKDIMACGFPPSLAPRLNKLVCKW